MPFRLKRAPAFASALAVFLVSAAPQLMLAAGGRPSAASAPSLDFTIGASALKTHCTASIATAKKAVDAIVATHGPRTFASVVEPLENAFADLSDTTVVDLLVANTSTDAKVRAASFACADAEGALQNASNARPELYAAVASARSSNTAKTEADKKLTELWYVAMRRAGAELAPKQRARFVALSDELNSLESEYAANLGNQKATVTLTSAQIAGLPSDLVASFTKQGDGYVVPLNESTILPVLTQASDASARKAYQVAYGQIAYPQNTRLLEKAIAVRDELAHLAGYQSWAAYVLADKMARTPARVESFLHSLDVKLLPRAQADLATLAALKAKDLGVDKVTMDPWDVVYYDALLRRTRYAVDDHAIAQYFPVEHVERAVFDIYSKLLGVTFAQREHPNLWNADVTEWTVTDSASGKYLGEFYLDLFPREGKFSHFAQFPLLSYRTLPNGSVLPPVSAIIGNWPKPAPGKPAVLTHDDVQTFFHEFGHNMAAILTTAPYETLSTGFRPDFIEAPSQMLENWVWDPAVLKQLSSNVVTGEPLPDDLIAKMLAARYVDEAYDTTRQIMLATIDMDYHTRGPKVDTDTLWGQIAATVSPMGKIPGTHPEANFGHIMGGYDAGYYGYLWSKVYAQDLFTAFKAAGLEDPAVGARYRNDILMPAREREPDAEVRAFLGRPMDPSAFYNEFDQEGVAPSPAPSAAP